jgi:DMSO reductase anchor subunit
VFYGVAVAPFGWIGAILSLATVYATSMIYAQLKTIPRWNTPLTSLLFMVLALAGGALISANIDAALMFLLTAGVVQIAYWIGGDQLFRKSGTTICTATGLGQGGEVRAFEPPHTGTNYLLREFVHVVGRKHATKLRIISLILMIGTPILALSLTFNYLTTLIAVIAHVSGVFVSRWLFFAQAEHVVGLYYGKR